MQDPDERVVVLDGSEASLVVYVLTVFERLLRQGNLDDHQLRLLVADADSPAPSAEILMAEVVSDASEPLRRQLS